MPADAQETTIGFRVPREVKAKLIEIAAEQGWSLSQLVRWIVMTATGEGAGDAAIRSTAWALASVVQARMPIVWERIAEIVEHELGAAMREAAAKSFSPADALEAARSRAPIEVVELEPEVEEGLPAGEEALPDEVPENLAGIARKRRRGSRGGKRKRWE